MPSARISPSKKSRCSRIFPSHRRTSADLTPAAQVSDELLSSVVAPFLRPGLIRPPPELTRREPSVHSTSYSGVARVWRLFHRWRTGRRCGGNLQLNGFTTTGQVVGAHHRAVHISSLAGHGARARDVAEDWIYRPS